MDTGLATLKDSDCLSLLFLGFISLKFPRWLSSTSLKYIILLTITIGSTYMYEYLEVNEFRN